MNKSELFTYLLKSTILSGIFFGYYWLFLKNTIYHAYNRFFLLGSMLLSLWIPFIKLSMFTYTPEELADVPALRFINPLPAAPVAQSEFAWEVIALSLISALLLAYLAYSAFRIYFIKRTNPVTHMEGFDFIETDLEEAPFSFFQNLFWKKSLSMDDETGRKIFQHELAHIQQWHSLDRLISQLICSIFWMNPFNWIIQKELQNIHEFIADRDAVGTDEVDAFAKMLLQSYYGNHFLNPTHSFYYSSIKRRIIMLTTSKSPKYAYARKVAVLPLVALTLAVFSLQVKAQEKKAKKASGAQYLVTMRPDSTTFSDPKTGKKVFSVSTKDMPPPPPPAAAPAAPEAPEPAPTVKMVYVDSTTVEFKGSKDGKNIVFRAEKVGTSASSPNEKSGIILKPSASSPQAKPLVVVDGVVMSNLDLDKISPSKIESVNVLKGEKALAKYPTNGANGVVEITTKKP
jgi:TonB-dependent SusC/RagA subfamily outer membrane receptor